MNGYDLVIALQSDPYLVDRLSYAQCIQVMAAICPENIEILERDIEQWDMTPDQALIHAQEGVRAALDCWNDHEYFETQKRHRE